MGKAAEESSKPEKGEKVELKKQITLLHGVAIIVGIIIGSGIFVSPVGILKETKSVGFSFVMWVVCGIYNTLCAVCYAELGTTIPQSGGEYVYIKRAFGEIPAFVCLWINFLLICPVGIAASALIFSLYILKPAFPDCEVPETGLALLAAVIISKFSVHGVLYTHYNCNFVRYFVQYLCPRPLSSGRGHLVIRSSICLLPSVCLSVILSHLHIKCNMDKFSNKQIHDSPCCAFLTLLPAGQVVFDRSVIYLFNIKLITLS